MGGWRADDPAKYVSGMLFIMKKKHFVWLLLAAAGVVFLVIGVARGEESFVLARGAAICLECIGIG